MQYELVAVSVCLLLLFYLVSSIKTFPHVEPFEALHSLKDSVTRFLFLAGE